MADAALVFDVQRFSVHDGPGIRTTVFLKGCPLRCRWCQNPESLRRTPEVAFHADRCRGVGACRDACPLSAVTRDRDRIDRSRCDGCGLCAPACPHRALVAVGRPVTPTELVAEVARDAPFYRASAGGVTLSGGEPMLHAGFVETFLRRCAQREIRVGLQTCGAFQWRDLARLLPLLEFVHFDLKLVDQDLHRELTGADNRGILANARRLAAEYPAGLFRTPVVPGSTDRPDDLRRLAAFLREIGAPRLHLLRYHAMGESKLPRLGNPLPPLSLPPDARGAGHVERAADLLEAEGIEVTR